MRARGSGGTGGRFSIPRNKGTREKGKKEDQTRGRFHPIAAEAAAPRRPDQQPDPSNRLSAFANPAPAGFGLAECGPCHNFRAATHLAHHVVRSEDVWDPEGALRIITPLPVHQKPVVVGARRHLAAQWAVVQVAPPRPGAPMTPSTQLSAINPNPAPRQPVVP
jgi:hypothetical protein